MKQDAPYTWDQFFAEAMPNKQEREAVLALLSRAYSSSMLGGSGKPAQGTINHFTR